MSRIFDFKKRFGQAVDVEEVKRDFVNKISHLIIEPLDKQVSFHYGGYSNQPFDFIALEFGHNPAHIIQKHNSNNFYHTETYRPPFSIFAGNDFEKNLLLIEVIYDYYSRQNEYLGGDWMKRIENAVKHALTQPLSLGISWKAGKFYPEGIEEFDKKLIDDVLKWLATKPKIQALYKNALDHYSQSLGDEIKRKDVISNATQAVEKLTQEFLQSQKPSFDNNFNELVDKVGLDKEWKKIFNSYKELSKEFGRHAGNKGFIPSQEDTEAFLYLSGLIMRLILQKSE
jgi:hypothetical protein